MRKINFQSSELHVAEILLQINGEKTTFLDIQNSQCLFAKHFWWKKKFYLMVYSKNIEEVSKKKGHVRY